MAFKIKISINSQYKKLLTYSRYCTETSINIHYDKIKLRFLFTEEEIISQRFLVELYAT